MTDKLLCGRGAIAESDHLLTREQIMARSLLTKPSAQDAPRRFGPFGVSQAAHILLTAAYKMFVRLSGSVCRTSSSSHALAFTREGKIILVKLRYASGWRMPGGGLRRNETPRQAVLRELREEIGLTGHGSVRKAFEEDDRAHSGDLASIFIVRDVKYRTPNWSFEVESTLETSVDRLPPDVTSAVTYWLQEYSRDSDVRAG